MYHRFFYYELFFSSSTRVPQENEGSTGVGPTSSVSDNMKIIHSLTAKWIYCWSVIVTQYWLKSRHLWQALLNEHQELGKVTTDFVSFRGIQTPFCYSYIQPTVSLLLCWIYISVVNVYFYQNTWRMCISFYSRVGSCTFIDMCTRIVCCTRMSVKV